MSARKNTKIKGRDPLMQQEGIEFKRGCWLSDGKIILYYLDKNRLSTEGKPVQITIVYTLKRTYIET